MMSWDDIIMMSSYMYGVPTYLVMVTVHDMLAMRCG